MQKKLNLALLVLICFVVNCKAEGTFNPNDSGFDVSMVNAIQDNDQQEQYEEDLTSEVDGNIEDPEVEYEADWIISEDDEDNVTDEETSIATTQDAKAANDDENNDEEVEYEDDWMLEGELEDEEKIEKPEEKTDDENWDNDSNDRLDQDAL